MDNGTKCWPWILAAAGWCLSSSASAAPVSAFGYSPLGGGVTLLDRDLEQVRLEAKPVQVVGTGTSSGTSMSMPLLLDGKPRLLVYVSRPTGQDLALEFFDLDRGQPHKSVKLGKGYSESTPVYDEERQKFYVLAFGDDRDALRIHTYDLAQNQLVSKELNPEAIFKQDYPQVDIAALRRLLSCKTALKVHETPKGKKLFWGCSIPSEYGEHRGVRGIVFGLPLDSAGLPILKQLQHFFPSRLEANALTGFNTGVYQLGGGFAFVPPDNLYLHTGNGPSFPELGNYGCAVLRLDANTLQVKKGGDSAEFLTFDEEGYHECFVYNLDYSTSSPALAKNEHGYLGVALNSAGFMQLYDPLNLAGSRQTYPSRFVGSDESFGQANIIGGGASPFQVVVPASTVTTPEEMYDAVLASGAQAPLLQKHGFRRKQCMGHLAPDTAPGAELALYYSGKFRDDFVALSAANPISEKITGFQAFLPSEVTAGLTRNFQAPYRKRERIGTVFRSPAEAEIPAGYELVPLRTTFTRGAFFDFVGQRHEYEYESFIDRITHGSRQETYPNGFILRRKGGGSKCQEADAGRYPLLHLYERKRPQAQPRWKISSFTFDKRTLKLLPAWEYVDQTDTVYPHSHFATALSRKNGKGIVVVPVASRKKPETEILILSSATGKLLQRIALPGAVHRSMPLITEKEIFIPTESHGIQVLRFRPGRGER